MSNKITLGSRVMKLGSPKDYATGRKGTVVELPGGGNAIERDRVRVQWDTHPDGTLMKKKIKTKVNLRFLESVHAFNIDRDDLYEYDKPKERTRKRLTEIAECGMEETGIAEFGYRGVMSGLYIEKVWRLSDEEFNDYMNWAKSLIAASLK